MTKFVTKQCDTHGMTDYYVFTSRTRCKKCLTEAVTKRRRAVVKQVKEEHGGCCCICGYDICFDSLVFHHKDPTKKELKISSGSVSLEKLRREASKCVLVCANCHGEIHAGLHPEYLLGT